jgi:lambda repressor-like predicted transcriptional regulator
MTLDLVTQPDPAWHTRRTMETTIEAPDWHRAGEAVEARIHQRGAKIRTIARQAGIDPTTLWKLRKGHGQLLSPQLRNRIDSALDWPPGTIERIASDPDWEPPVDIPPVDRDRLVAIERRLDDLQEQVGRLLRLFEQ